MSELTKTNNIQTSINPGGGRGTRMVNVEQGDGQIIVHQEDAEEEADGVPEEGESVEVVGTTPEEDEDEEEEEEMLRGEETEELIQIAAAAAATAATTTKEIATTATPASPQKAAVSNQLKQSVQRNLQDVKVDNWATYLLSRLQVMYDRGDFCDLTMQFHTNQLLKVHKVVVNLCTEYFANLERLFGLTDGVLVLPPELEYQAMLTIVKFFYTGKLEIGKLGDQFLEVYKTVKLMNITILIKLLESQRASLTQANKDAAKPIVFKQAVEAGRPPQKSMMTLGGTSVRIGGGNTAFAIQGVGGTKTLQVASPGAKLPPGMKTKTVLARVQPQGMRYVHQSGGRIVTQKKLPIWKERKFAVGSDPSSLERWPIKDEPARPTRFEWGDPDEDPLSFSHNTSTFLSHSLMEKQKASPSSTRKIEDIFDAVKTQNLGKRNAADAAKNSSLSDQPPSKMSKVEASTSKTGNVTTPLISPGENDDVNLTDDTVEEEVSTTELAIPAVMGKKTSSLKPALKSQLTRLTPMVGKNDPNLGDLSQAASTSKITLSKSVRFAPEIEKENGSKSDGHQVQEITEDVASSHSKIIAEVLKKFPDLVKDKQNIKLKIVHRGADASPSKDKSKVSYIVLKSTSSPDSMGAVLLKKSNHTASNKAFWDGADKDKKVSGAENMKGPWLCGPCGDGDENPMEFESYYMYRRHLVDVHEERIDARICEYCGQKASKRNLLLYHLYTKHAVAPPKNMHFPNCDRCDYIALSESLLTKHKLTHDATKEYSCEICNASFKSSAALQGHMAANLHRNKDTKVYECPYCRKPFVRNINLKGHIRSLHRDIARVEEMDDPRLLQDDALVNRPINVGSVNRKRQFPSILGPRPVPLEIIPSDGSHVPQQVSLVTADGHTIEILHGLDPNTMSVPMTLVPSSEAEAMTNVASSIAASLGLEQGVHGTEFITGDGSQAVYIMDSSQPPVEVDMSAMGISTDGTMIYEGEDPNSQGPFIVQDIHGNQFRKMTGIDENGKPVIFFQLSEEHGQMSMAPTTIIGEDIQMSSENAVYVSSHISVPVNVTTDSGTQPTQVILTSEANDGTVYDIVPDGNHDSHNQVRILTPMTNMPSSNDHEHQLYQEDDSVQQLHIVLDHNEEDSHESEDGQDEGTETQERIENEEIITAEPVDEEHDTESDMVDDGSIMIVEASDTHDDDSHHEEMGAETEQIEECTINEEGTQIVLEQVSDDTSKV